MRRIVEPLAIAARRMFRHTSGVWIAAACTLGFAATAAADWREFRGADGRGVAANETIRTQWSATDGIAWQADLPGKGASSPIVVGDVVIVTASSGARQDLLHILALDKATGRRRWHRTFWATGRTLCHPTSAVAAGTPASDGKRIVALFSSCDLLAVDLEGRLLWQRNLAVEHPQRQRRGHGIEPADHRRHGGGADRLPGGCLCGGLRRCHRLGPLDRAALEGRQWSSPLAVTLPEHGVCVLLQGPGGLELRKAATEGRVVVAGGVFRDSDDHGTGEHALCAGRRDRGGRGGRCRTGVAVGQAVVRHRQPAGLGRLDRLHQPAGVLGVGSIADGVLRGQVRLAGSFWASPILVGRTIVACNKEGTTFLVSADGEPKIVAQSELPGTFTATPAVADGSLYLRSETALWKVAAP